ncbi:conserved hypothetical protein [Methylobacterium sp. 4-46]|uniref:hypothetical protein n=1 Tax=unclassified Methylobacterium TaxID=2615210 RepID=UPI000152C334|nr:MULTISPECIES: hypothetical protein [Methylobacterium]ACA20756.1 conserved hypothetical protein [Methylobacterium sp. 4-46]WFT79907.1 hypothetical protein QA634_32785 [Methylobacterium nodulans]
MTSRRSPKSRAASRAPSRATWSMGGFDPVFYLATYPDVAEHGCDPLEHYLTFGWKEGRDPSAQFSTSGYLSANPDVAEAGINPLVHYRMHGLAEGRSGWQKTLDPAGIALRARRATRKPD